MLSGTHGLYSSQLFVTEKLLSEVYGELGEAAQKIKKERQRVAPFLDKSDISGYTTIEKALARKRLVPHHNESRK